MIFYIPEKFNELLKKMCWTILPKTSSEMFKVFFYKFFILFILFKESAELLWHLLKLTTMDLASLKQKLAKHDQEHLLSFWNDLDDAQKKALYDELNELDLDEVMEFFERTVVSQNDNAEKLDDKMSPLLSEQKGSMMSVTPAERKEYEDICFTQIANGKMGILLLAGGQGTRLGVSYPKGMFSVGLPSGKTLFQLQAERILKLQRLAFEKTGKNGHIVWYIMTSAATVHPTTEFFKKNNFFGLDSSNVIVFQQGTLPCFTFSGKIILSSKHQLSRAPDGNGGLYRALRKDGILDDMCKRGVDYIQLYCVDNILVRVGDPVFGGYCISKGAECANKVVPKGFPSEAVGITCKVAGKFQVVEYSEITSKSAELRNEDGSLTYGAANICIHFFTRNFLTKVVNEHERQLVHHIAKKKIPFINDQGEIIKPERPNGIKMEKFVFDVFQFAQNFVVWECVREDEFAPLKNAPGAADFTPEYCRDALYSLNQKYIMNAGGALTNQDGVKIPQIRSPAAAKEANNNNEDGDGTEMPVIDISPLVSYAGEGLENLVAAKKITVPANIEL